MLHPPGDCDELCLSILGRTLVASIEVRNRALAVHSETNKSLQCIVQFDNCLKSVTATAPNNSTELERSVHKI